MKMLHNQNILAIYPQKEEFRIFDNMPPLGMAWIAAFIRQAGYNVRLIDQQVESTNIANVTEELQPLVVLIGGTSHTRFESFALAETVKNAYPETTVVYGGPHASFTAEDTLKHTNNIDIIVHGEGEYTSLDLIKWKAAVGSSNELSKIDGISYRLNGNVVSTGWRPFIRNLDVLPEPARDLLPLSRYKMKLLDLGLAATNIITARGCPINCSYCSASQMFGKHYAHRSSKLIVDEIENCVKDYGIKGLKIFDSTFTLNKKHVLDFCEELEKRDLVMPWECEVRVGTVDRPLLERMKKAGCYYIDMGIESGDQHVLQEMGKQIRIDDAEALIDWANELDIRTKVFFTFGHIRETYKAGLKTIEVIKRNRKKITLIGNSPCIRIYPGTRVEKYALENDLFPEGFQWSKPYTNEYNASLFLSNDTIPILLQPQMGIRELRRLRIRYGFMRVLSINYIFFKINNVMHYNQIKKFLLAVINGLFKIKK